MSLMIFSAKCLFNCRIKGAAKSHTRYHQWLHSKLYPFSLHCLQSPAAHRLGHGRKLPTSHRRYIAKRSLQSCEPFRNVISSTISMVASTSNHYLSLLTFSPAITFTTIWTRQFDSVIMSPLKMAQMPAFSLFTFTIPFGVLANHCRKWPDHIWVSHHLNRFLNLSWIWADPNLIFVGNSQSSIKCRRKGAQCLLQSEERQSPAGHLFNGRNNWACARYARGHSEPEP